MAYIKDSLNHTFWSSRLHLFRIGTVAQQQAYGAKDNTLTSTRLTRYYREAWKERNV